MQRKMREHAMSFDDNTSCSHRQIPFAVGQVDFIVNSGTDFARAIRPQTILPEETDYVTRARGPGSSPFQITYDHILPGVVATGAVIPTVRLQGVAIPPSASAWGVRDAEGRDDWASAWWQVVFPGTAIFPILMSLNFLGDWMRDSLGPRPRQTDYQSSRQPCVEKDQWPS